MKLLFYYARQPNSTWLDRLIAKVDGGVFSHVEIITAQDDQYTHTRGCHAGRGGVTTGLYTEPIDRFMVLEAHSEVFSDSEVLTRALQIKGSYSYLGALKTVFKWIPKSMVGYCCSTWVATVLGIDNPKNIGIKDLYFIVMQSNTANPDINRV